MRTKCREESTYQSVSRSLDLLVNAATLVLAICYGSINQTLVAGLVGSSEDERRVCGCILGLVHIDCCDCD